MGRVSLPNPGHPTDDTQKHAKAAELNDQSDNEVANTNRMTV